MMRDKNNKYRKKRRPSRPEEYNSDGTIDRYRKAYLDDNRLRAQDIVSPYPVQRSEGYINNNTNDRYNDRYYPRRYFRRERDFTPEERAKVLARVRQVGVAKAAEEFNTTRGLIMRWLDRASSNVETGNRHGEVYTSRRSFHQAESRKEETPKPEISKPVEVVESVEKIEQTETIVNEPQEVIQTPEIEPATEIETATEIKEAKRNLQQAESSKEEEETKPQPEIKIIKEVVEVPKKEIKKEVVALPPYEAEKIRLQARLVDVNRQIAEIKAKILKMLE